MQCQSGEIPVQLDTHDTYRGLAHTVHGTLNQLQMYAYALCANPMA
jgi:hypothetical protein